MTDDIEASSNLVNKSISANHAKSVSTINSTRTKHLLLVRIAFVVFLTLLVTILIDYSNELSHQARVKQRVDFKFKQITDDLNNWKQVGFTLFGENSAFCAKNFDQSNEFSGWQEIKQNQTIVAFNQLQAHSFNVTFDNPNVYKQNNLFNQSKANNSSPLHESLVTVISSVDEFETRIIIRQTWGWLVRQLGARLLFVIGESSVAHVNDRVLKEQQAFGDLLQMNVTENYYSLTLKTYSILSFVSKHCNSIKYVFKIDSDVIPNWLKLVSVWSSHVNNTSNQSNQQLICTVNRRIKPIRDHTSKWYVPHFLFPESTYPDYCGGPAYVIPVNLISLLLEQMQNSSLFYLEDVFFTGILRRQTNRIGLLAFPNFLSLKRKAGGCFDQRFVFHHSFKSHMILDAWQSMNRNLCTKTWLSRYTWALF